MKEEMECYSLRSAKIENVQYDFHRASATLDSREYII